MNTLTTLWHTHERELRRWLLHHTSDPALADDLLQDVFLRVMRHQASLDTLHNERAWLFEVARNRLSDHFRRTRPAAPLPEDFPAEETAPAPVDSLARCLPRVLAELSAEDRDAIERCDLGGLPQQAYADELGITLAAAKSRVRRARKRLRAQLATACQVRFDDSGRVCCFVPRD
ncbi:sigma-70 family RNA polymerase sigma factor [Niveibacterium sp.]|uniref:sigma-70 family RNA polymerase sigma factor n=1 Tax=Niveibacterium sp. TaxID=2017444 RepID=UPI0035B34B9C